MADENGDIEPEPLSEVGSESGGKKSKGGPPDAAKVRRDAQYSKGKASKHSKEKLMQSEGIIPIQSGTNKFASQKGLTGFGVPRDVLDKVVANNLAEISEENKSKCNEVLRLQTGTNKYASQKGMTGIGRPRDAVYKTVGTGGAAEVEEEKAKMTEGIIPLQSGTNKLASQAGMTGFGMPRSVLGRYNPEQNADSQGFIHLQMGTNRFASQAGMTGFGMPRRNITGFVDEARADIPWDESQIPRQSAGSSLGGPGSNQSGMTGFGAFRNNTIWGLKVQDRQSQGLIPYQMGINWGDSQAGKTGFGMPRQVFTEQTDFNRPELPEELARDPNLPKWSSNYYPEGANQAGMTGMGMPRDVKGNYLQRMW